MEVGVVSLEQPPPGLSHRLDVGAAGVSAVPDSARVVQLIGQQEDPNNYLLMHAMAPNVAGVIGSAIGAGILWSVLVE